VAFVNAVITIIKLRLVRRSVHKWTAKLREYGNLKNFEKDFFDHFFERSSENKRLKLLSTKTAVDFSQINKKAPPAGRGYKI